MFSLYTGTATPIVKLLKFLYFRVVADRQLLPELSCYPVPFVPHFVLSSVLSPTDSLDPAAKVLTPDPTGVS